jgi:hypothetical protein
MSFQPWISRLSLNIQMFFLDELPGMPSDRDIEFVIDLVPGIAPIFKRPYRMATNQLAELKEQLQQLLDVTPTFYKNKNFVQIGVHIKMHIKL